MHSIVYNNTSLTKQSEEIMNNSNLLEYRLVEYRLSNSFETRTVTGEDFMSHVCESVTCKTSTLANGLGCLVITKHIK